MQRKLRGSHAGGNTLLPELIADPEAAVEYLVSRVARLKQRVLLHGAGKGTDLLRAALARAGKQTETSHVWPEIGETIALGWPQDPDVIICSWPESQDDWARIATVRAAVPNRVLTLQELLMPLGVLTEARRHVPFTTGTMRESLAYYSSASEMGPLRALDRLLPIAGRRVIEFGPLDGYQTAALVNLGAASVTCIEARPQNVLKTLAAKTAFGWRNVEVITDDFHNVHAANYGAYDLAVAHGVYYHSAAPFVFFENLFSLASSIFFGGFIATDDFPETAYVFLEHRGERYQAKPHADGYGIDQGINPTAFYFTADALRLLFARSGYEIATLPSEEQTPGQPPDRYLRFLARRLPAAPPPLARPPRRA